MAIEETEFVVVDENDIQGFNAEGLLPLSSDDIIRIRDWLAPTDYTATSSEWKKHCTSHLAGTGSWILDTDQYRSWHDSNHGGLWIKAVAGAGKSVAAATIVSRLAAEEKHPVLHFFFRHIVAANQTPKSLIRDFLSQVLQFDPRLQKDLFELINDDQRSLDSMSSDELWNLLVPTLNRLPRVYCIIDALDEMDVGGEDFLDQVVALSQNKPASVKVLMTSRPIPRVERHVRNMNILQLVLQPQLVSPDISFYVRHRLAEHELSREMRSRSHDMMCERADGHFLYARLMMDNLLDATKNVVSDEQKLLAALNGLPSPMAGMYTQMLSEHAQRTGTPQTLQVAILQWVTRAERPLRLLELSALINTQQLMPGTIKDAKSIVREACGPLLEILEDETVHPIHHSFTEYLYDDRRLDANSKSPIFPVLEDREAQRALAIACLDHLASGWHTNCLPPALTPAQDGTRRATLFDKNVLKLKHPFLDYAAESWSDHVRKSKSEDNEVMRALSKVFITDSDVLRAWLTWEYERRMPGLESKTPEDLNVWKPLHVAAEKGLVNFVEFLLRDGHDIEQLTSTKHTPLSLAARAGHHEVVRVLLTRGAKKDEPNDFGLKPLHHAALADHWEVVKLLLEAGVDPFTSKTREYPGRRCGNSPSTIGDSPVKYACSSGHLKTMNVIIPFLRGENLQQALYWALVSGQTEIAVNIIQRPDVNVNYYYREHTPLYLASRYRNLRVMHLLFERGAEIKLLSSDYMSRGAGSVRPYLYGRRTSPLHAFAGSGSHHMTPEMEDAKVSTMMEGILMLVEAGADPNLKDSHGSTVLHTIVGSSGQHYAPRSSARNYVLPALSLLFERGLCPDTLTKNGSNALHVASGVTTEVLDLLIDHGLDVNAARESDGETPLMAAVVRGEIMIAHHLLRKGANANSADCDGNTPLHLIGKSSQWQLDLDLVRALIAAGADVNSRNRDGDSALHVGEVKSDLINLFLRHGFNLESKNKLGQTLLFQAVSRWSHGDTYKMLVELGADPSTRDSQGRTVLHVLAGSMYGSGTLTCDKIRYFMEKGVDPQAQDAQGNNLWHTVAGVGASYCQKEQLAVMNLLMKHTVSPTARNFTGRTPFHVAFTIDSNKISYTTIDFLFEHTEVDINISDYDRVRPLHLTASCNPTLTCFLLERGADCTVTTIEGQTPLMVACRTRQSDIVCILLDYYQRNNLSHLIDHADKTGQTALHHACRSGRPETVGLLLEAGASVNSEDKRKATPMHACACFLEEGALWQKPLGIHDRHTSTGPKANYVLSTDRPSIDVSTQSRDPIRIRETVRLLVKYDADVSFLTNEVDINPTASRYSTFGYDDVPDPKSPLAAAIEKGCGPMVSELLLIQERLLRSKDPIGCETKEENRDETDTAVPNSSLSKVGFNSIRGFYNRFRLLKMLYMSDLLIASVLPGQSNFALAQGVLNQDEEAGFKQLVKLGARFDLLEDTDKSVPSQLASWGYADLLHDISDDALHMTVAWTKELATRHVNWREGRIHSLLYTALIRGLPNMAVVKVVVSVLQHDVNEMFPSGSHKPVIHTYAHLLARPSHWWQTKALAYILDNGASSDAVSSEGETPLIVALRESYGNAYDPARVQAVEVLLEHGANPNAVDKHGLTCLNIAAKQPRCVRMLLKHGADPSWGARSFLLDAIESQDVETIRYIIDSGPDVNRLPQPLAIFKGESDSPFGGSSGFPRPSSSLEVEQWSEYAPLRDLSAYAYPIHVAASRFFKSSESPSPAREIIRVLLSGGANPFLKYEDGSSVLHCIIRSGGTIEPFLTLPSFDTELRDAKGCTFLLVACDSLRGEQVKGKWALLGADTIELLIKCGASTTAVDIEGCNALHYLVRTFPQHVFTVEVCQEVIQPFLSSCLSKPDLRGRTPYHYAVLREHTGLIQLLLAHGSEFRTPDPTDNTTVLHHLAPQLVDKDVFLFEEVPMVKLKTKPLTNKPAPSLFGFNRTVITRGADMSSEELTKAKERSPRSIFASLVSRGLSINHPDMSGETPLFKLADAGAGMAKWVDEEESGRGVGLLLCAFKTMEKFGANLKARNNTGESVLHKLAKHATTTKQSFFDPGTPEPDWTESFTWLVSKGVDVTWEDHEQRTCLDVAAASGATWMTKLYERGGGLTI